MSWDDFQPAEPASWSYFNDRVRESTFPGFRVLHTKADRVRGQIEAVLERVIRWETKVDNHWRPGMWPISDEQQTNAFGLVECDRDNMRAAFGKCPELLSQMAEQMGVRIQSRG